MMDIYKAGDRKEEERKDVKHEEREIVRRVKIMSKLPCREQKMREASNQE
jgi:hypothetical protein